MSLNCYCSFCVSFKLWKCIEQYFFSKHLGRFKKIYSKLKRKQLNVLNKYDRKKRFYRFRIYYYYLQYINKIITQGLSPIQTIDIVNYL